MADPNEARRTSAAVSFGHPQLLVRARIAFLQAVLTCVLVVQGIALSQTPIIAFCQLVSCATLAGQYYTKQGALFVVRGAASFVRGLVLMHVAACGRVAPPWRARHSSPWHREDVRAAFRVVHVVAALRMFANCWSLCDQFRTPGDGVSADHGHRQLWIRARVRASGVPIQLLRGILKLALLRGTRFERGDVEVAVNFVRALALIPASAYSLDRQYRTSGVGGAGAAPKYGASLELLPQPQEEKL